MQYKIRLEPIGKTLLVNPDTPLSDILPQFGVEFPCGGNGICGGCKVKILQGQISLSEHHSILLEKLNLDDSWRLACLCHVNEDLVIEVLQFESITLTDNTSFAIEPQKGYGIAVDLGTTTIVAQLIDLSTGTIMAVQNSLNPQARWGADIMSRITFAMKENGLEILKKSIRKIFLHLIEKLISEKYIVPVKILISGNTVMHHLFCGIDVNPLSQYPFNTQDGGLKEFKPADLGWKLDNCIRILFLPSIGSFIGSDILAGIKAAGFEKSEKYLALIDLGTNGEIVVGNKNGIICASTAAGPAFEGTNITMGMKALSGAISEIRVENGKIKYHVIGNQKPKGICGSGLIDAIATLLKLKIIDETGYISGDKEKIEIGKPVYISQKDIREFQLAKAAIAAGIQILIDRLGITCHDIDRIYIAGGFGNFLNLDNVTQLGLIEFPQEKIKKLGNSALLGTKMFLFSDESEWNQILKLCKHISLESDSNFQNLFAEKMFFWQING